MVINYSQIEINCFVLFLDFILLDMTKGINVCFWKASNDILHLTFPKEIEIFIRGKDEDKGIGKNVPRIHTLLPSIILIQVIHTTTMLTRHPIY